MKGRKKSKKKNGNKQIKVEKIILITVILELIKSLIDLINKLLEWETDGGAIRKGWAPPKKV